MCKYIYIYYRYLYLNVYEHTRYIRETPNYARACTRELYARTHLTDSVARALTHTHTRTRMEICWKYVAWEILKLPTTCTIVSMFAASVISVKRNTINNRAVLFHFYLTLILIMIFLWYENQQVSVCLDKWLRKKGETTFVTLPYKEKLFSSSMFLDRLS